MNSDRIHQSSDQPKLINVASGTDNLQKHRNKASMISEAWKNQVLHQGESTVSREEQNRYPSSLDSGIQGGRKKKGIGRLQRRALQIVT